MLSTRVCYRVGPTISIRKASLSMITMIMRCTTIPGCFLLASMLHAQTTSVTDAEIRFANQKLELRFSRSTGRWLALYDLSNHQQVMNEGQHLASVFLTTDGRTTVTSGR